MSDSQFGRLLKDRRIALNMTLREFSRLSGYDASNLSKIERGIIAPPPTIMLKTWAKHLHLVVGSDDYADFLNIASISRDEIPVGTPDIVRNQLLPALFRTEGSKKLTEDEYRRLVRLLNQ